MRVWQCKYQRFSLTQFKLEIAKDGDLKDEFDRYGYWFLQKMREMLEDGASRDVAFKLSWPAQWQLKQMEIVQASSANTVL